MFPRDLTDYAICGIFAFVGADIVPSLQNWCAAPAFAGAVFISPSPDGDESMATTPPSPSTRPFISTYVNGRFVYTLPLSTGRWATAVDHDEPRHAVRTRFMALVVHMACVGRILFAEKGGES